MFERKSCWDTPADCCDVEHGSYLGIYWNGQYLGWTRLPFGHNCSPVFFAKVLRPVVTFLRKNGLRVVQYVDDFILCANIEVIEHHKNFLLKTLGELGWTVNWGKSSLEPSQCK